MKVLPTLVIILGVSTASVQSAVVYDESVSGDLSGVMGAPTAITLANGFNTIVAQMGDNGDTGATNGQDADYFTFTLNPGQSVTALLIDDYTFSPSDPGVSFMGYVAGASFAGQDTADIDGFVLFNGFSGDVLPALAGGALGPGTYSIWIQETSPNLVDYQLILNQVPEPASAMMLAAAALGFAMQRRRR